MIFHLCTTLNNTKAFTNLDLLGWSCCTAGRTVAPRRWPTPGVRPLRKNRPVPPRRSPAPTEQCQSPSCWPTGWTFPERSVHLDRGSDLPGVESRTTCRQTERGGDKPRWVTIWRNCPKALFTYAIFAERVRLLESDAVLFVDDGHDGWRGGDHRQQQSYRYRWRLHFGRPQFRVRGDSAENVTFVVQTFCSPAVVDDDVFVSSDLCTEYWSRSGRALND